MSSAETAASSDDFERIGREMIQRAIHRAAGRESGYCIGGTPSRRYYVSNLTPESQVDDEEEVFTETTPTTIGLQVTPSGDTVEVDFAFEVYLRCFPTYREYRETVPEDFDPTQDAFYVKERVEVTESVDLSEAEDRESESLSRAVNSELAETVEAAATDRVIHPIESMSSHSVADVVGHRVPDPEDLSESEYEAFLETVAERPSLDHEWAIEVDVVRRDDDVVVRLTNEVATTPEEMRERTEHAVADIELGIFNPQIRLTGRLEPYQLDVVSEDFRYDRRVWGKGINCSVDRRDTEDADRVSSDHVRVSTQAVPEYQTYRFVHRGEEDRYDAAVEPLIDVETELDTSLESLWRGEPLETLRSMADAMRTYLAEWEGSLRREKREDLSEAELDEFDEAAQKFRREIENFERGIEALKSCPEAMQAFRMTNRAFAEQPDEVGIPGWRPFQLVFIVSNVSSLLAREYEEYESHRDDEVEVLWFPTGGGKTEAYLGLIVFGLFFDRLRGKERGVTAWIRFPLTLLGSQQLRRFLRVLTHANAVGEDLDLPGEQFSVGYYAGSTTTPNRIGGRWNNLKEQFESPNGEAIVESECQSIDSCPRCDQPVDVRWDPEEHAVHHVCTAGDCDVGRLPLYVTDHEIYRNVPSVLLGTLDRITVVGSNPRFANLIGNLTSRCPVHGYGYSGKCSEQSTIDCDEQLETVDEQFYDPVPSLHLIDEVHLLGEELGVFAGHYETLYLELCEQLHGATPKVVTSTATISDRERGDGVPAYERHVRNLFLRDANRFPVDGPELGESFYGTTTEEKLRRFYGIAPRNKTHIYAVLDLVKQFHEVVRDYRQRDADDLGVTPEAKREILLMYELSVVYFLRLTEKDRFVRSIDNQVEREMREDGYDDPIQIRRLTGDVDDPDLESLERPDEDFPDRADLVAATSFIGHGVDVSRFNNMFFFGYPSRTFQYIQSSNRVGREVPGFVVDVFKPFDQRDNHRYRYFQKTHEYLERSVEDVSVDRWSKFSLDKTFPGVFKGFFLQYFRPMMFREYDVNLQSSYDLQSLIDPEAGESYEEFTTTRLVEMLHSAYGVGADGEDRPYFEDEIESRVESNWDYWLQTGTSEHYTQFREDEMQSLRDIGDDGGFAIESAEQTTYSQLVND